MLNIYLKGRGDGDLAGWLNDCAIGLSIMLISAYVQNGYIVIVRKMWKVAHVTTVFVSRPVGTKVRIRRDRQCNGREHV